MRDEHDGSYSPEIDGLRAIAVLTVLFFHANVPGFSGGFIGVDIFFVISGFLITRIIHKSAAHGSFSYGGFIARRVRRLFPAYFVTVAATFAVAFFLLLPRDFSNFAASVLSSLLLCSNFFFWLNSGYFDAESTAKPLLHTWSLSVEEQFYLIWPLLIGALASCRSRLKRITVIAGIALISLTLAYLLDEEKLRGMDLSSVAELSWIAEYKSLTFYLTPFRVFEFAIGALLSTLETKRTSDHPSSHRRVDDCVTLIGFSSIFLSVVLYSGETAYPSTNALLPCVGTALLLMRGRFSGLVAPLRHPALVYVGKISYSLYLVHWPIFVLYRAFKFDDVQPLEIVALCVLSMLIAMLLFHFVETPFRVQNWAVKPRPIKILGAATIAASLLAIPAILVIASQGAPQRFPASVISQASISEDEYMQYNRATAASLRQGAFDRQTSSKILVIGDSQARDFIRILQNHPSMSSTRIRYHLMSHDCPPLFELAQIERLGFNRKCASAYKRLDNEPLISQADIVVLAAAWTPASALKMDQVAHALKGRGVQKVIVVGPKALPLGGPQAIFMAYLKGANEVKKFLFLKLPSADRETIKIFREFAGSNYSYIDLLPIICRAESKCAYTDETGEILYGDRRHLTPAGAKYFAKRIDLDTALMTSDSSRMGEKRSAVDRQLEAH